MMRPAEVLRRAFAVLWTIIVLWQFLIAKADSVDLKAQFDLLGVFCLVFSTTLLLRSIKLIPQEGGVRVYERIFGKTFGSRMRLARERTDAFLRSAMGKILKH